MTTNEQLCVELTALLEKWKARAGELELKSDYCYGRWEYEFACGQKEILKSCAEELNAILNSNRV